MHNIPIKLRITYLIMAFCPDRAVPHVVGGYLQNEEKLKNFLKKNVIEMPRITLR